MGLYQHLREFWKKPDMAIIRQRMIQWRKEPAVLKIDKPSRLDRARSLGYKAKQGFVIARVRVSRGGHYRPRFKKERHTKKMSITMNLAIGYQAIAERRANKKFHNLEVLNSYLLAKDGLHCWYEVILVDPCSPVIRSDEHINWICNERGRVYRGLTSAERKSRGLRRKGKGAEKARPSARANKRMIR